MFENRFPFVLILMSLHFNIKKINATTNIGVIDKSDLELLSEYDLRFLKDFVHRRGKGFVSRVPLTEFSAEKPQDLETSDDDIISINGQVGIVPIPPDRDVAPKLGSSSTDENNFSLSTTKKIDFQQLAFILQKLNKKRRIKKLKQSYHMPLSIQSNLMREDYINTTKVLSNDKTPTTSYLSKKAGLQNHSVSGTEQMTLHNSNYDNVNYTKNIPSEHKIGEENAAFHSKENLPIYSSTENESGAKNDTDSESDIRELTRQLNILLTAIKQQESITSENQKSELKQNLTADEMAKPKIYILREGNAIQYNENDYEFIATITLIVDNSKIIIVDTGLATDPEIKQIIDEGLTKYGLKASDVNIVISTHGHPAHAGNNNMFVNADQYNSVFQHRYNRFKLSQLFEDEVENLTPNILLKRTPGHTSEDISVIVMNTEALGTVVVSGDVFVREEDSSYPMMWKPLSSNITEQAKTRKKLFCLADNIIPGHGPMFSVSEEMKLQQHC